MTNKIAKKWKDLPKFQNHKSENLKKKNKIK
jgi:hypothetical protein